MAVDEFTNTNQQYGSATACITSSQVPVAKPDGKTR